MPTLDELVGGESALTAEDLITLHTLIADWQLLADLSFADLLLWVPLRADANSWPSGHLAVAQMRPTTGPTVLPTDLVGTQAAWGTRTDLDGALSEEKIMRSRAAVARDGFSMRDEVIPVRHNDRVIALVSRHTNANNQRTAGRLEEIYLESSNDLAEMMAEGLYPIANATGNVRVGDGLIRVDAQGKVRFASPNALSALRRFGIQSSIEDQDLGVVITEALKFGARTPVDESLIPLFQGRSHRETEIERRGSILDVRVISLSKEHQKLGALVLLHDVSEIRRRERELLSKDVTIREIHHRVKNNLQTVSALLRLQARRLEDPAGRAALNEAVRRVAAIAVVHETLSNGAETDENVDIDLIIDRLMALVVDVSPTSERISVVRAGNAGHLPPHRATPLAMVLAELFQNALEHGLASSGETLTVTVTREANALEIKVSDDGAGLPADFDLASSTHLGLQIVKTLTENELQGSISLKERLGPGTDALLRIPL